MNVTEAIYVRRAVDQRPRWVVRLLIKLLVAAAVIAGCGGSVFADDASSAKADFEASCAACHGKSGKGDGPVAEELRTKPSDLTMLAKKNDGVFPTEIVTLIIDGRTTIRGTIRAHGTSDMPVWGPVFQRAGSNDAAGRRISAIIDYLKSIQVK
jgi:mono/diheme cytochrome c family protein